MPEPIAADAKTVVGSFCVVQLGYLPQIACMNGDIEVYGE